MEQELTDEEMLADIASDERTPQLLIDTTAWAGSAYSMFTAMSAGDRFSPEEKKKMKEFLAKAPAPVVDVGNALYAKALLAQIKARLGF